MSLDDLEASIKWVAGQKEIDADRIAIMGASKGSELALLLASLMPQIKDVVAYSPTSVVWQAPPRYKGEMPNGSSWIYKGTPLPYISLDHAYSMFELARQGEDVRFLEAFQDALHNDKAAVERASIRVEDINGPILMITGGDDLIWPSREMARDICQRRKDKGCKQPCMILDYSDAGHVIRKFYLPASHGSPSKLWAYGGTMCWATVWRRKTPGQKCWPSWQRESVLPPISSRPPRPNP